MFSSRARREWEQPQHGLSAASLEHTLAPLPSLEDTLVPGIDVEQTVAADGSCEPGMDNTADFSLADGSSEVLDRIGRYLVTRRLGAGGMGEVYAAYDPDLDRRVAIKLLLKPRGGGAREQEVQQRLVREAQALAQLNHPGVIQVYDVGTWAGQVYIAVEYVDGETLGAWCARGPGLREVLETFHYAGRGLAAAHEAGIIHRDFKPDNVLVDAKGRVRVLDFGLAVSEAAHAEDPSEKGSVPLALVEHANSLSVPLTMTGALLGTPAYMAPEQFGGLPTSHWTDQFSFCVALYEALYGERPFAGDSVGAIAYAVLAGRVREPRKGRRVPARLRKVLLRGLSVAPEQRYASMDELLAALRPFWSRERRALRRAGSLAAAGLLAVGLSFALQAPAPAVDVCADSSAAWAETWTPAKRAALEQRFDLDAHPHRAQVYASVAQRLDDYAEDWAHEHQLACRAHGSELATAELYAAQTQCFDRARRSADAVVAALMRDDAELERALELGDALPGLERCTNVDVLLADVEPPAAAQAQSVERLRSELDRVRVDIVAARFEHAKATLEDIERETLLLGYVPLSAERRAVGAELAAAQTQWSRAIELARKGYAEARASGDEPLAQQLAASLAHWTGEGQSQYEASQVWVEVARASADRLGLAPHERARLDAVEAHVVAHQGDLERSIGLYRGAIAELERSSAARAEEVAELRKGLAYAHGEQGDTRAGLEQMDAAYDAIVTIYGERHPVTADYLIQRGQLEQTARLTDASRSSRERALEILRGSLGPRSGAVGKALFGLANLASSTGDHEDAVAYLERALPIFVETRGPRSRHAAAAHNNLGNSLRRLERYAEAVEQLVQAQDIFAELFGPDAPKLSYVHYNLGQSYEHLGDPERALSNLAQAYRIHQLHEFHPLERGRVTQIYAELQSRFGDLELAGTLAQEAVEILAGLEATDAKAIAKAEEIVALAARGERV